MHIRKNFKWCGHESTVRVVILTFSRNGWLRKAVDRGLPNRRKQWMLLLWNYMWFLCIGVLGTYVQCVRLRLQYTLQIAIIIRDFINVTRKSKVRIFCIYQLADRDASRDFLYQARELHFSLKNFVFLSCLSTCYAILRQETFQKN